MGLVRPFIENWSRNGLSSDITRKIKFVLGEPAFPPSIATELLTPFPPMSEGLRRCEICKAEITGQGMKKQERQTSETTRSMPMLWNNCLPTASFAILHQLPLNNLFTSYI